MRWVLLLYAICTLMLIAVVHQKLKAGVRAHITHPTTTAAENQSSLTSWSRSIEYLDTGIAQLLQKTKMLLQKTNVLACC